MNNTATDYQKVLTEVLQKQIVILGPTITLIKARNVEGVNIDDSGRVISLDGDGHALSVKVLEQFRELSPLLVKKTMAPLLNAILYSSPRPAQAPTPAQAPAMAAAHEHIQAPAAVPTPSPSLTSEGQNAPVAHEHNQ